MNGPALRAPLLAAALGPALLAHAGSIISTNLPAGKIIVNVDATSDGAYVYDSDQSSWFHPYALNGTFTQLTLGPGTYSFDLIDPADSVAAFPNLTAAQRSGLYSGWTYNTPWTTDYFVFDSSALNDPNLPQLFCGASGGITYGSGEDAYHGAKIAGYSSRLFTGPGGRLHGVQASMYTLTQRQTLVFVVPDQYDPDNAGGVSVVVTQAVPEPTTFVALALGGLALFRRRTATR